MSSATVRTAGKLDYLVDQLADLKAKGLYTTIRTLDSAQGAWLEIEGRRVLNFCSNNYLGLANDPLLVAAAKEAMDRYGVGPGAVRTIAGTVRIHTDLERRLAQFKGVDDTIVLQSGFTANTGAIAALVGPGDAIISDALNHASIIDGVRLAGKADRYVYEHCDMDSLEEQLKVASGKGYRAMLIITDGVFSMDGDIAPLDRIAELAERYGAITMVDDAHGEGVIGRGGRGAVDHFGLHGVFDIEVGTMSKAFGVMGGYVAAKQPIVDWLRQRARPFLFSSALTIPDTAACLKAVDILEGSTERVDRLWANARYFQARMKSLGFNLGVTQTPISPVILGEAQVAQAFSRRLFEEGIFGTAIAFPTVPLGKARIRVMISAAHSEADLDVGIATFAKVGRELGVVG
ncbi:MAG: glycine C-acetyltransferase [Ardenticatenia bacterium]|nr:glycine C-acetyltransferase [Ardenticatenia bacterium]HRA20999.1 glycine C-acetyltransferase [Anaerolineae bacterium]